MKIEIYIAQVTEEIDVEDEALEGLTPKQREHLLGEIARETLTGILSWDWREVE